MLRKGRKDAAVKQLLTEAEKIQTKNGQTRN